MEIYLSVGFFWLGWVPKGSVRSQFWLHFLTLCSLCFCLFAPMLCGLNHTIVLGEMLMKAMDWFTHSFFSFQVILTPCPSSFTYCPAHAFSDIFLTASILELCALQTDLWIIFHLIHVFMSSLFSWQALVCWLWAYGCGLTPGQQGCLKERTRLQSFSLVRLMLKLVLRETQNRKFVPSSWKVCQQQ